ncbi:MAG: HU family DNA-binding protein, partial [Bacteroidaceae bacterium]|nr:HU family DNA-binding protein [Bacteroidaceae bacterium]
MDKKLTKEEVISQLSKAGNVTRKEASTFLKALSETLLGGLNEDEVVKVNGLGSFKITNVADRESVDVNTGERIVIPGYKKLSFTADKSLNAALNASEEERENMLANSAVEEPQHPVAEQPETVAEEPVAEDAEPKEAEVEQPEVVVEEPQQLAEEQPETVAEEPVAEDAEPK